MRRIKGTVFKELKIVHKLVALFMCMAIIVAVSGGYGIWSINEVGGKVQEMLKARAAQEKMVVLMKVALEGCRSNLLKAAMVRSDMKEFELCKGDYEVERVRIISDCDLLLQGNAKLKIEAAPKGSQLEARINEVKRGVTEFGSVADKLLARKTELLKGLKGSGVTQAALIAMGDEQLNHLALVGIHEASDKVMTRVDDLLVTVGELMLQASHEVSVIEQRTRIAFGVVIVAAVLLAMIMGLLATRHLGNRIKSIAEAMDKGASGDLTIRVEADSADELGTLGANFNAMAGKLAGMVGKVNKTTEELIGISNNLAESSKQVINAAQRQVDGVLGTSSAMTQINASIKGVTHGVDGLSLSAAESSSSILEMAASVEEVALNVENLAQSVDEVSSSIIEMAASIKQIDTGVASLTETIATTASSVMEMDSSIRQVEKNAMDTAAISEEVRRTPRRARSRLKQP